MNLGDKVSWTTPGKGITYTGEIMAIVPERTPIGVRSVEVVSGQTKTDVVRNRLRNLRQTDIPDSFTGYDVSTIRDGTPRDHESYIVGVNFTTKSGMDKVKLYWPVASTLIPVSGGETVAKDDSTIETFYLDPPVPFVDTPFISPPITPVDPPKVVKVPYDDYFDRSPRVVNHDNPEEVINIEDLISIGNGKLWVYGLGSLGGVMQIGAIHADTEKPVVLDVPDEVLDDFDGEYRIYLQKIK